VKIRAAETDFLWYIRPYWHSEKLGLSYAGYEHFPYELKKIYEPFLYTGEVWKSPFWVDAGDDVKITKGSQDEIYISTDDKNWRKYKKSWDGHRIRKSGHLYFKAKKSAILESVYIKHQTQKKFSISPGETVNVKVNAGDCYEIQSSSGRYFFNGNLAEGGTTRRCFKSDETLAFKGSVRGTNIKMYARIRKGTQLW